MKGAPLAFGFVLLSLASNAAASDENPRHTSYETQTLASDLGAFGLMATGLMTMRVRPTADMRDQRFFYALPVLRLIDSENDGTRSAIEPIPEPYVLDAGMLLYTLGPPVIHALHGRPDYAMMSGVVRTLGPSVCAIVAGTYGALFDSSGPILEFGPYYRMGFRAGALVGLLASPFVDAFVLSQAGPRSTEPRRLGFLSSVGMSPLPGGASIVVAGELSR